MFPLASLRFDPHSGMLVRIHVVVPLILRRALSCTTPLIVRLKFKHDCFWFIYIYMWNYIELICIARKSKCVYLTLVTKCLFRNPSFLSTTKHYTLLKPLNILVTFWMGEVAFLIITQENQKSCYFNGIIQQRNKKNSRTLLISVFFTNI